MKSGIFMSVLAPDQGDSDPRLHLPLFRRFASSASPRSFESYAADSPRCFHPPPFHVHPFPAARIQRSASASASLRNASASPGMSRWAPE